MQVIRYTHTIQYELDGEQRKEVIEQTRHNELQALARFKRKNKKAANAVVIGTIRSMRVL
jgi:hypothetical protein